MRHFILNFFFISFLTACGQKGDLYLPDKNIPEKGAHQYDTKIY
jgi:predicted small lipoprotein YifL